MTKIISMFFRNKKIELRRRVFQNEKLQKIIIYICMLIYHFIISNSNIICDDEGKKKQ